MHLLFDSQLQGKFNSSAHLPKVLAVDVAGISITFEHNDEQLLGTCTQSSLSSCSIGQLCMRLVSAAMASAAVPRGLRKPSGC